MISYTHPDGVQAERRDGRRLLTLPQGGRIAVDAPLYQVWRAAHGVALPAVVEAAAAWGLEASQTALILACLAQAGLLARHAAAQSGLDVQAMDGRPAAGSAPSASLHPAARSGWEAVRVDERLTATTGPAATNPSAHAEEPHLAAAGAATSAAQPGGLPATGFTPDPSTSTAPATSGHTHDPALVSVVVVSFNSRAWLEGCFASLAAQNHPRIELILVDNASQDDSLAWAQRRYPQVQAARLDQALPFAAALNVGVARAHGEFILLLNPDVTLPADAVGQMLAAARAHPACAAVAPKLRLMWAPAFLNGLGNQVGALLWGSDVALGALDMGQLDGLAELPSACFAAALLPRAVLDEVGPFDEGFPMYYEDSEWSYRARLLGRAIVAAPQALIYHAFSSRVPQGQPPALSALKLRRLAYGRLRWANKLLSGAYRARFNLAYGVEDGLRIGAALLRGRLSNAGAHWQAWQDLRAAAPQIAAARRRLAARRKLSLRALFRPQRGLPPARVWRGLPLLTLDIILTDLAPWLARGAYRSLPEWQAAAWTLAEEGAGPTVFETELSGETTPGVSLSYRATPAGTPNPEGRLVLPPPPDHAPPLARRFVAVLRHEGAAALLLRMIKALARRLAQP